MKKKQVLQAKIIPKRTKPSQKLAYILRPFVLYMLVKTFTMLLLAIVIPTLPISGIAVYVEQHSSQISAVVNGVSSIAAVCFLLNDFLIEASVCGEIDIDKGRIGQAASFFKTEFFKGRRSCRMVEFICCIVLGMVAACVLNLLIEWISAILQVQGLLGSRKYETVETIQYSVPVWLGLILYGVVSPLVEEMVFRGILYSRIRRFYGVGKAVLFSALLFGVFHANLPQFVYGSIMGGIIALCYEYMGCFAAPVLMHVSANLFVFVLSVFAGR